MSGTRLFHALLAASALLAVSPIFSQTIFINEFLASNSGTLADEHGDFDDWVELYNAGNTPIDIGGMFATDDLANPTKWQIPTTDPAKTTVPPGGFLLLWFDGEPAQGPLHIDTKLGAGGEDIGFFAPDGATPIDALTFGPQSANVSFGRVPDGGDSFEFFNSPTPGATNVTSQGGDVVASPVASVMGGFFNSPFEVNLTTATPAADIRYTLDGSEPDDSSPLYTSPLPFAQTATLRARAFAVGLLPSAVTTHTYLFNADHTFPVVALSFKDGDFFDPATGIYPNYLENWERPVHVEFFEEDGSTAFSQDALVEIHGTGSASNPQKSLRLKALADAGDGFFKYPIFLDQPIGEYKSFLLRNAGQDWNITQFRDAFVTGLVRDLGDVGTIIQQPDQDLQAFRPAVVYLNGQYWGIHNLREQMTEKWVEAHTGLAENDMDFLDDDEAKAGDFDQWNSLVGFLGANQFGDDAKMAELGTLIDLPNFLDYTVFNVLVDNGDWPGKNLRRWRPKANGGLWRFISFDLDFSFGLFNHLPTGVTWNTGDASANSLSRLLDDSSFNWPNPWWATMPFRKTMENEAFRRDFINRTADFLNVLFSPQRVNDRIDEFIALYQPEIQAHFEKWSPGWNPWADNVEVLRKFANERPAFLKQHFIAQFDEVAGTATVTLQVEPAGSGAIQFSTLSLPPAQLPWSGEYFTGVDIPVKAVAAPGYVFVGWSSPAMGSSPDAFAKLAGDETLVAYFEIGSTVSESIVINEINYNSPDVPNSGDWVELFNPFDYPVDVSGWVVMDEGGYYNIPNATVIQPDSYLVVVESGAEFSQVYPWVANHLGDFGQGSQGFKLSNNSELIQLKNANLVLIDSVRYDDELPWPTDADGGGKTLQLVNYQLDNALASSWKANAPTPGMANQSFLQTQVIDFPTIPDKFTSDQPFGISATASSGLPVTFSIVSGPATINGDVVTLDGTVGIVTIKAEQLGSASWQAAPFVLQNFLVLPPPGYCAASAEKPWWEWIERVEFGEIDNPSFKKPYSDFTQISTVAPAGETMLLSITPAYSWEVFEEYFRAWIDFNRDGDFTDPGELVLEATGTAAINVTVGIPIGAVPGATRMRISMRRGQYAEPCGDFSDGEVEDYTVILSTNGDFSTGGKRPEAGAADQLQMVPNPVTNVLGVRFSTAARGLVRAAIINSLGRQVLAETMLVQEGEHYLEMDVSSLPEGSFRLFLLPERQKAQSCSFVKMRP